MALERTQTCISLQAGQNLSSYQYRAVEIGTDGQVDYGSGSVAAIIGILQNKPTAAGQGAQVCINGVSKMVAGGSITAGSFVKSDAAGLGLTTSTDGNTVIGRALETAQASGNVFEVLVNPQVLRVP